jgi:hypothetical protein
VVSIWKTQRWDVGGGVGVDGVDALGSSTSVDWDVIDGLVGASEGVKAADAVCGFKKLRRDIVDEVVAEDG